MPHFWPNVEWPECIRHYSAPPRGDALRGSTKARDRVYIGGVTKDRPGIPP